MSTHNIRFHAEKKNYIPDKTSYLGLCLMFLFFCFFFCFFFLIKKMTFLLLLINQFQHPITSISETMQHRELALGFMIIP